MNIKFIRAILSVFIGLFFVISFAQNLRACSCFPLPSVYEAFNNSDAVFTGKIISAEDIKFSSGTEKRYRVQLIENFKGVLEKEFVITAGFIESSCFWGGYKVGDSYLIYSYGKNDGVLGAETACSRITLLESARNQIYFIRELSKGRPEPQVYGSVVIQENDLQTNEARERGLSGFEVTVKSDSRNFKAVTDKDGFYRFNNLPLGVYQLKLTVPDKYKLYVPENQKFTVLKNKKICRNKYERMITPNDEECLDDLNVSGGIFMPYTLRWNNEIRGKIIDSNGKAIEKARIKLLPQGRTNDEFEDDWRDNYRQTGEDYFVIGKTPGKYILAVELDSTLGSKNKIRFFYPQTTSFEKAQIIDLTETTQLNIDFCLPAEIKIRKLIGEVLRESGGSVGGFVSVSLDSMEDAGSKENKEFASMAINAQGRFEFDTLENEEYWLHIWLDDAGEVNRELKEVRRLLKTEKIKIGKEEYPRKVLIYLPQN